MAYSIFFHGPFDENGRCATIYDYYIPICGMENIRRNNRSEKICTQSVSALFWAIIINKWIMIIIIMADKKTNKSTINQSSPTDPSAKSKCHM